MDELDDEEAEAQEMPKLTPLSPITAARSLS